MLPLPVIFESQDDMSVVNGATTEPRIRINRPDDENTRCRVSSARGQPKDFSPRDGVDQFFRDKDSHGSGSVSADRNPAARSYGRTKTLDGARTDRSRPPQDRYRASFP